MFASARPLYTLLGLAVWSTSALLPSAPLHPEIVPSSEANRKASVLKFPAILLNTTPVTDPSPGMVTVKPCLTQAVIQHRGPGAVRPQPERRRGASRDAPW